MIYDIWVNRDSSVGKQTGREQIEIISYDRKIGESNLWRKASNTNGVTHDCLVSDNVDFPTYYGYSVPNSSSINFQFSINVSP